MAVINRENAGRLSVADAKRLIAEALPPEPAVHFYESPTGTLEPRWVQDGGFSKARIDAAFMEACSTGSVTPRYRYQPMRTDYPGAGLADSLYTITHEEFSHLAGLYGLTVNVGGPPPEKPAPADMGSEEQPRAHENAETDPTRRRQDDRMRAYLDAGHAPPKRSGGRWHGVSAVAKSLGIRRQTLTKDLKAKHERMKEEERAGAALRLP